MSANGLSNTVSRTGWRSIRPWTPPLYLIVREVSSVSATFILSSSLSDPDGGLEPSLTSLDLITTDDGHYEGHSDETDDSEAQECKKKSIISDALAGGLSINVNGSNWQRVFIRIDDTTDEAIIIIYGLMPGRQYDIDLALVQGEQSKIRRQVITQDADMEPSDAHTDPESPSLDNTNSSDPPLSTPSTSPTGTHPSTPSPTNVPLTIEDRLAQLQATLTQINAERETLSASLKSAKRDSQKADGALRSDIDALRRASEKHAAADARAKQRILSLQEAVKRAQTATCETEALVTEVQGDLPGLNKKRADKEEEYDKIKGEADRVRNERALEAEKEKKRIELMRSELSALNNKLEKLHCKKEKLETGIIADLEGQLKEVECEMEKAEMESYVNVYAPAAARAEPTVEEIDTATEHSHSLPYLSTQRVRHQTFPAGTIGRPPPVPIQRPPSSDAPFGQLWAHPVSPRLSQTTHQTHNQRSSSLHHQTPTLLTNPRRRKSSVSTPPQSHVQTSNPSPSSSTTTSATTLSSKAPAFEPGRPLKTVNSNATGVGAFAGTAGAARGVHTKAHSTPQSWLGR